MVTHEDLWAFFEINLALYGAEHEFGEMDFVFLMWFFLKDKKSLVPFNEQIH